MKKTWKKLLAAGCALSMFLAVPGMTVMAGEEREEEMLLSGTVSIDEYHDFYEEEAEAPEADQTIDINDDNDVLEDNVVGAAKVKVGDGVTAVFDGASGTITLYSNEGTLSRDWVEKIGCNRSDIKTIKVASGTVHLPVDSSGRHNSDDSDHMFACCDNLTKIDLTSFDTSKVENMGFMFFGCRSLVELDLSNFNTSNVTNMEDLFYGCNNLKNIELRSFDTSKVSNMYEMFGGCESLIKLDVSGFDTQNVIDMGLMFYDCASLTTLNLRNFNTSNVVDMHWMFDCCKKLESVDLSSFDTSNVEDMWNMFNECRSLGSLNLASFNTSNVVAMDGMFCGCSKLKKLDLSGFDTKSVSYMSGMFYDCRNIVDLDLSSFRTQKLKETERMFYGCSNLTTLKLNGFNLSNLKYYESMFEKCDNLSILYTPVVNTKSIELPVDMFDSTGKNYTHLPTLTRSIVLAKTQKLAQEQTKIVFTDVQDPNHAFYKAIYWAADAGITKGYPDGTFGIDRSCTRGEMIMFLWRYAGKPAVKALSKSPFKDVPKNHAFYNAIIWASQKGITKGYPDGTFGINRNVSRGECMMFLWRLKGKPAPKAVSVSPFKDVPKNHAFYNAILWGAQKKITNGYTSGPKKGTFGINENCTRGAIVTFLYRAK